MAEEKIGRPRRYAIEPRGGFASTEAGYGVAALDELSQRHFDLIRDVPPDVLHWVPAEGWYSIAMITAHLLQAEAGWIARVTGGRVPEDIGEALGRWRGGGEPAPCVRELEAMGRRVREEVTTTRLAPVGDLDAEVPDGERVLSVRGVLMHLLWHWSYHGGQTGLIRGLRGLEYRWTFDERIAAARPGSDGET
jgi:uncharacterized damage-inducible protein DinB